MRPAIAICCGLVLSLLPVQALAEVDVSPVPWSPKVHVHAGAHTQGKATRKAGDKKASPRHPKDQEESCSGGLDTSSFRCPDDEFGAPTTRRPADPTEGAILQAVREIGLPSLQVRIQPGSSTLVNVRTIFYTRPQAFHRSVTLLGYDIDLVAQPIQYTWRHGDGTTSTTSRPGKPYPSMDVTYRYRKPAETVNPRVDVTYRVRYRVDGGNWTTIGQTLLASGPTTALEVKEAAPVLTAP
jgi:hypothetical protein